VKKNQAELVWDDDLGQYYGATGDGEGGERQIWMEDARSMELKVSALKEYGIAGIACWRLGQETEDIWKVIGGFLK
jgi:spore germination protein YaaH